MMRGKLKLFSSSQTKGFTLLEMVVTLSILALLTTVALPVITTSVKRDKEIELRQNLRLMRQAMMTTKNWLTKKD
jgi:general secretion pathway protein G